MGFQDKPDSLNDVVSTVSLVSREWQRRVLEEMPSLNGVVYDPDFSYETGINLFLKKNHSEENKKRPEELIIYNRTICEDSTQGLGSRARATTIGKLYSQDRKDVLNYSVSYCEYDINFMYVTHSIALQEKFEQTYMSNTGISALREIPVDMPNLGEFKYFFTPQPLTDVLITGDTAGASFKALLGIVRVRGFFFVFSGKSKLISELVARMNLMRKNREDSVLISEIELKQMEQNNG